MTLSPQRLHVAARANVPPFHVMDLLAAAAQRQRTHGDSVNLLAGKLLGVGAAGLTQFLVWTVSIVVVSAGAPHGMPRHS